MQGSPTPKQIWTDDLQGIILLIQEAGQLCSDEDAVYHDEELEFLVPALARVFLKYRRDADPLPARMAMIQIFDTITRFVNDPDLLPEVDIDARRMAR